MSDYEAIQWGQRATAIDQAVEAEHFANHVRLTFRSWTAWCDYCTQPSRLKDPSSRAGHDEWAGGSWDDAVKLAREGWRSEIVETDERARNLAYEVIGERFQHEWSFPRDLTGEVVDVPTFLSGEPECFIDPLQVDAVRAGAVVRLVVSTAASATVNEETMRQRGAAVVALVDVLAQAGYSLEIWAVQRVTTYIGSCAVQVLVQHPADPIDMGTIMYALAHPTMLRRLVFSAEERLPKRYRDESAGVGHGYGSPQSPKLSDLPEEDGPTILLDTISYADDWSEDAAREWIISCLDSLAGE